MTYAVLRAPHPNSRYDASLDILAKVELEIIASYLNLKIDLQERLISGLRLIVFEANLTKEQIDILAHHSSMLAVFELRSDNSLMPLEHLPPIVCAKDMPSILKYKGKTNESFTRFLINVALYSSAYEEGPISLLDPLCGKGTTLFCALGYGINSIGIENDKKEVEEGVAFAKSYFEHERMKHSYEKIALLAAPGKSRVMHEFITAKSSQDFKDKQTLNLSIICADAKETRTMLGKRRFDIIVADLPYGILHTSSQGKQGRETLKLVAEILLQFKPMLKEGGIVAFSFNSYTTSLTALRKAMEEAKLEPLTGGVYDNMEHWVEQAIKRDIVVARNML